MTRSNQGGTPKPGGAAAKSGGRPRAGTAPPRPPGGPVGNRPTADGPGSRRRTVSIAVAVAVAVAGVIVGVVLTASSPTRSGSARPAGRSSAPTGPEGVPLEVGTPLAPSGTALGQTVDGIQCDSSEQVAYHVHTHLSVYVDGRLRPIPAGIGLVAPVTQPTRDGDFDGATRCYYWLHVHAQDGVIHIESPVEQGYTLGQFFDLWGQPLGPDQVGPATGALTVFVDGRPYPGDPRGIPLGSHEDIQIDVGAPTVGPVPVDWGVTSL